MPYMTSSATVHTIDDPTPAAEDSWPMQYTDTVLCPLGEYDTTTHDRFLRRLIEAVPNPNSSASRASASALSPSTHPSTSIQDRLPLDPSGHPIQYSHIIPFILTAPDISRSILYPDGYTMPWASALNVQNPTKFPLPTEYSDQPRGHRWSFPSRTTLGHATCTGERECTCPAHQTMLKKLKEFLDPTLPDPREDMPRSFARATPASCQTRSNV